MLGNRVLPSARRVWPAPLSTAFFSEKREQDQHQGWSEELMSQLPRCSQTWQRRDRTDQQRRWKLYLSEASPETYPLSEWLMCFVWTKEIFWPFNKNALYLVTYCLRAPACEKAKTQLLVWITLPPSGCSGQRRKTRGEEHSGTFSCTQPLKDWSNTKLMLPDSSSSFPL